MNLLEIIEAHDGIDKGDKLMSDRREDMFNQAKNVAQSVITAAAFLAYSDDTERQYKENKWSNEPNAKKKNGDWKNRAFTDSNGVQQYVVPNSWYCNKRVIIRAMEAGLDLSKGKSELEKELASIGKTNKSARDKLKGVLDTARKLVAKMEEEEGIDAFPIANQIDVISNSL